MGHLRNAGSAAAMQSQDAERHPRRVISPAGAAAARNSRFFSPIARRRTRARSSGPSRSVPLGPRPAATPPGAGGTATGRAGPAVTTPPSPTGTAPSWHKGGQQDDPGPQASTRTGHPRRRWSRSCPDQSLGIRGTKAGPSSAAHRAGSQPAADSQGSASGTSLVAAQTRSPCARRLRAPRSRQVRAGSQPPWGASPQTGRAERLGRAAVG